MKRKVSELSRLYLAALRQHLKAEAGAGLEAARELGRRAIATGQETLDLAKIHELALITLATSGASTSARKETVRRAGLFFAEAITPLEQTHRAAKEANQNLNQVIAALNQRTLELAGSVEDLKQEIVQRKTVEESLRSSELTSGRLLDKSRQMQEELRHLSRQLLSAQEEERRKISRELHDVIAQTLTGINVRLAALKTESTAGTKELQKRITSTQRLVEKSVDIVHRFARELRPAVLDDLGLIPALQSFMKVFSTDTGVRVSLSAFAAIEQLDTVRRTVLYRIAQEALTNVARHAQASQAQIIIQKEGALIRMEVKDNGRGFEVDGAALAKKGNRLGLLGMRERVEMIGGTFCVESSPGHPTTIRVEIPADKRIVKPRRPKSPASTPLECP